MQIRIIILLVVATLILEFIASFFVYFEKGKVLKVKSLFEDIPIDFPENFYIFLLRSKKPHFFDFFYHLIKRELYLDSKISKYKINEFRGYRFNNQVQFYGRSELLALSLAFWSYERRLKFPNTLKIGIVGDLSSEGKILPIIGLNLKLEMAMKEDIDIMFIPQDNINILNSNSFKVKGLHLIFVKTISDAKKNLLKFVLPKVVNER